jgi:hypothetical protein
MNEHFLKVNKRSISLATSASDLLNCDREDTKSNPILSRKIATLRSCSSLIKEKFNVSI